MKVTPKTEKEIAEMGLIPAGTYDFEVKNAEDQVSKASGNDLSTPHPEFDFPGLKPGDNWCLCAPRWQEAFLAGKAPKVVLAATHRGALAFCRLEDLRANAVD